MPPETLAPHRVFEGKGFKKGIKKPACGRHFYVSLKLAVIHICLDI